MASSDEIERSLVDGFSFYRSYYEGICKLDDDRRLKLYDAMCFFAFEGVEPQFEDVALAASWEFAKPNLYQSIKNRTNGKKGGRGHKKEQSDMLENPF